jgi:hypothetical protein
MFFIPLALAALSAYGSYQQSSAQDEQGDNAKKIGEFNAKVDENDALQTEIDSMETVRRMRADAKKIKGSQRVAYAKGGVVETGTPLEVMSETEGMLKLQELDQQRKARMEATNLRRRAAMSRYTGDLQYRASKTASSATLLAGVGNAAGTYYNARG